MIYVTLIAGIALLVAGGDFLVRGAVGLAGRLGIPHIIIGLTIVAFGTSAPELVVSLKAALADAPGIAVGNVVGSNIANIFLVIGLPAVIAATVCDQTDIERNAIWVLAGSVLFIALCHIEPLTVWHGVVMLAVMTLFLADTGRRAAMHRNGDKSCTPGDLTDIDDVPVPGSVPVMVVLVVVGLIALTGGGHLTVEAAKSIASRWGVSESAIGLTIVALGTSLPELATSLVAVFKRHHGIALGNVLGSNLFNILAIMGVVALVHPVNVPDQILRVDLWVMLFATVLVLPFTLGRIPVTRVPGLLFVIAYVVYVALALAPRDAAIAANF